jgi:hypothetical protein
MDVCRECGKAVSTEARECPHCGIGAPSELGTFERAIWRRRDLYACVVGLGALILVSFVVGLLRLRSDFWTTVAAVIGIAAFGLYWTWADNRITHHRAELLRKRPASPD